MLRPEYTSQFKKDIRALEKRKGFDMESLKKIIELLCAEQDIPEKCRDHSLKGDWVGCRDCHIKPDWLLIYQVGNGKIVFERTGTHSDLF